MAKCVVITMEDDGTITVNECEPKEEAAEGYEKMPVESLEQAFDLAGQILTAAEQPVDEEQKGFDSVFTEQKGM